MTPQPLPSVARRLGLSASEEAIARSVLYASLFEYPLTLSQLRQTLIESAQTPTQILATFERSGPLRELVEHRNGFFYPAGRQELVAERRRREGRSRAFLKAHRRLLRLIGGLPYVRLVALSGSIAHLNLEKGGDLDIFIVTRGAHVWSTAVAVVLLAKGMRRRRTLCANFVVADTALAFAQEDLFTASQIVGLKPLAGAATFQQLLDANPSVRRFYPNFHAPACGALPALQPASPPRWKRAAEWLLMVPAWGVEWVCRHAYGRYLRRRAGGWESPDQVRLEPTCLKLHTRSHRSTVLNRFDDLVRTALK
jgi:hypothetical protein